MRREDEEEGFPAKPISSGFERTDLTYSTGRPLHKLIPSVLAAEISHAFDRIPILRNPSIPEPSSDR